MWSLASLVLAGLNSGKIVRNYHKPGCHAQNGPYKKRNKIKNSNCFERGCTQSITLTTYIATCTNCGEACSVIEKTTPCPIKHPKKSHNDCYSNSDSDSESDTSDSDAGDNE
jgi:hypothetical protein